jgi:DNA-binding response OmpR family regulator
MKILIADDDRVTRCMLEAILNKWGYETAAVCDGLSAWKILDGEKIPLVAILDWMMPGLNGLEVCKKFREKPGRQPCFLILLTIKGSRQDIVTGLKSGADDYMTKPFDIEELQARVNTGVRMVELQRSLAEQLQEKEEAFARVKKLQGLLPICCYCKNIRDDQNYWKQVEDYLAEHTDARFSHGICPRCYHTIIEPQLKGTGKELQGMPAV